MNAKVAEENEIYGDTRRGCNLSGRCDGQRPPHAGASVARAERERERGEKNKPPRAIANLFDSLRGGLACAAISPSREMTRDDTANMKVK